MEWHDCAYLLEALYLALHCQVMYWSYSILCNPVSVSRHKNSLPLCLIQHMFRYADVQATAISSLVNIRQKVLTHITVFTGQILTFWFWLDHVNRTLMATVSSQVQNTHTSNLSQPGHGINLETL